MPSKYPIPESPDNLSMFSYSKEGQEFLEKEDERKERELVRQERESERRKVAKEREIERQEKIQERKSDRRFSMVELVIAAVLGALFTKLVDFIF